MEDGISYRLVILFFLFILSALFSASEAAYFSLTRIQLNSFPEKYGVKGEKILKLLEKPKELLITIYIGNETVNVLISVLLTSIGISLFGSIGVGISIGVGTYLLLIFSEITPKTLAIRHAEEYALFSVTFLHLFHRKVFFLQSFLRKIALGIMSLFGVHETHNDQSITEEEIKTIVDVSEDEGNLKENEKTMITNVFELNDITAEEIFCNRADMVALEENNSLLDVLTLLKENKYSRFPVYKENLDNITGILLVKDILRLKVEEDDWEHMKVSETMYKPFIVPESKKVGDLLKDFQKKRIHMAIVADEFGVTNGLITLDDIINAIIGKDYGTNYDTIEGVKVIDDNTYHINASLTIIEFNKQFEKEVSDEEFDTVGGFVFHLFGYLPEWGEKVVFENLTFYVIEKKGFRLTKLKVITEK